MATFVLPGDIVRSLPSTMQARLGPGVQQVMPSNKSSSSKAEDASAKTTQIASIRAGLLGSQPGKESTATGAASESIWVESRMKRYVPAQGEPVIGVIIARHAEGYRVDIGSAQAAALDALAFEDATKRNKPDLKVGAVVYARVSLALPFCEPEIECVDPKTGKSAGFGALTGGMLARNLELGKCRALLSPQHPLLPSIGSKFPFELAIGVNGRIWVKAAEPQKTIELLTAIKET